MRYLVFFSFLLFISCTNKEDRPNVILILSDDHAWTDYSFMGHPIVQTPNLDRLASESVVFVRGYVPTALCRPSLMTLATGLYPHQHGITGNDPRGRPEPLYPREELLSMIERVSTLPEVLGENGYLSFQSGKWWEGDYTHGGFTHGMTRGTRHGDDGLVIGREGMEPIFDFIELAKKEDKPFFVWYAPFLPHTPHTPPDRLLAKYRDKGITEFTAKYYAMIEWFDETCGSLLDYLDENGLRDNTIVYYVADNGWIQKKDANGYAADSKQSPMEGGVRTPIMISAPGWIEPALRNELVSSIDFVPTILGALDIEAHKELPGKDLWQNLVSGDEIQRDILFGEGYGHDIIDPHDPESSLLYRWCIAGSWKLIQCYDGIAEGYGKDMHEEFRRESVRLYDLENDPFEKENLVSDYPGIADSLGSIIQNGYPLKSAEVFAKPGIN